MGHLAHSVCNRDDYGNEGMTDKGAMKPQKQLAPKQWFLRVIGQNVLVVSPNEQDIQTMYEARSKRQHRPNGE